MTRSHDHEIEIDAPVEDVWRALTDSEELTRWYVEAARVEPGEGGSYWVSWGGGIEGRGRIDAWEPGSRLRLVASPANELRRLIGRGVVHDDDLVLPRMLAERVRRIRQRVLDIRLLVEHRDHERDRRFLHSTAV